MKLLFVIRGEGYSMEPPRSTLLWVCFRDALQKARMLRANNEGPEQFAERWELRDETGKRLDWFIEAQDVKGTRVFASVPIQAGG